MMRKNLTQMFLLLSIALFSTLFAGCNTEEVDPVVPSLEISQEAGGEAVSSLTLAFGSAEATQSFAIRCNRNWTAVSSNDEWVVVSPESGEGDATVNVSVTRNPGTKRTATITVSTILYKKTVTIEQAGEQAEAQVIYFDNLDGEEASNASGSWPFADTFEGFNKQGTGVAEVTYKSSSVTVRANSVSNDTKYNTSDYSANIASGVNNLYFQAGATFEVQKIALEGLDKLQLTLGVERNEYGNYDAPFNPEEFIVSLSADGNSWVELPYTRSTYKGWDMATADFQLKEAPEYLYIKMAASVATRVDDIKLTTGVGGTEIDLAAGETPDEPGVDGTLLYYESFDGTTLSGNTSLDNFEEAGGFVRQGLGGAAVSYAGTTFDFRKTSASSGYDGVSGVNNAFGNSDGKVLYANNINVGNAQNLDLSFGLSAYSSWEPANFIVSYTTDGGTTWNDLTLTRESAKGWKLTTASFTVAEADAVIGLRFFVKVANSQQYRVDDITLTTADEGVQIEAIPTVNTEDAEEVTMHGAKLSGSYEFDGTLSEAGIAYKAASAEDYTYVQAMALASPFSITLNTLEAGTTYEYFAYVKADGKEYRGDVKSFSTEKDQSQTVTYFADDFADVVNNMHYESGKWTLVSSDPDYAGNCYMGWYGKIYNGVDYYIQCAPYNSSLSEVVAYAVMTKFNVAEAVGKKLTFDLAWYYQKASDGSKLEIVASKDFNGDVDAATWEVVKNISYTDQKTNEWISHEIDLSAEYGQEKALAVAFRYTGKGDTYRLDNVEFGAADTSDKLAVTTGEATEVTASEAVLSGSYKGGTEAPAEVGVEYRLYGAADYTKKAADKVAESFEVKVDNLVADTRYEFRAYAVSGTETVYGEAVTFNTLNDTPDEITPIADVNKGNTYTMSGTVTALSARGFILTDESGSIFFYGKKDYEIGQQLTVKGEIDSYNKGLQIVGSSATITAGEMMNYTYPTPAVADAAAIDAYIADGENRLATYVTLTGDITVSGTYYNIKVDGTDNMGSIYYPTDEIKAKIQSGSNITVVGYAISVSGGKYYNIIAVDVTTNEGGDTPTITPIADVKNGGKYAMEGIVTALSSRGFILTDDSGSILYYDQDGTDYEIGQKLTVEGTISAFNKGLQIVGTSATVTVNGKEDYTYPTPVVADAAAIDAYISDQTERFATYVSLKGTMSVSGNYYNVIVDGTSNQGSVYYPTDAIKAKIKDGEAVTIEGYAIAVSGGKYYNVVAVDVKSEGGSETPTVTPIAEVVKGGTYTMEGTVTALSSRGFILTDDSGSILYYDQNGTDYEIGQQLTVEGEIDSYNKGLQIVGSSAKVTVNGKVDYTYPTPATADAAAIDAYVADQTDRLATYVSLKGTMSVSGSYYNVIVDGTSNQGSIYYPTDEIKAKIKDGETVTIEGYATSVSGGRYYNVIAVDVKTEGGGDTPTSTPIADVENGNTYTMEGVVTALTSNGFVLTDNSGSIFFYGKKNYEIGQQLTVEGEISVYNKGLQINGQSATITEGGKITYQYPTPTVVDAAAVDAFIADQSNRLATYVSVTGDASVSGNYYNLIIDGTSNQGSFYSPTDEIKAKIQDGMNITVVGYALSVSGGRFYNIIAVDVTVNGAGAPSIEVADEEMSFVAAGEMLTTAVTTSNQGSYGIFAKTSDPHFTASVSGTTLSVTAAANTGAAKSATVTVYLAESEGGEAVASADVACTQLASGAVVAYTTGFEASEGFKSGTNYQNADPVYQGAEGSQWGVVFGTSSTTSPITGDQSMQMRWYTSKPTTLGYAFTNFNIGKASKIKFSAKNTGGLIVTVSYSVDNGETWLNPKDYTLKTSAETYEYIIGETPVENVRFKFQVKLPETAPTSTSRVYIDDVEVYGAE